jgi:transcriptional regulator with XRE-family HTH domain
VPNPGPTKLEKLRRERGVSQNEIAWVTGISLSTYRRLELGKVSNPPLRYLVNCAIALGVPLDDVLEDSWREWENFSARAKDPPADNWFLEHGS